MSATRVSQLILGYTLSLATWAALIQHFAVATVHAQPALFFERIASFPVASNMPADVDPERESSSEIISVSDDGMTLVYSDSPMGGIGLIDISDAGNPSPGGFIKLDGEPTSVVMGPLNALVAINTSQNYLEPSGHLSAIELTPGLADADRKVVQCSLEGQPDAIALSADKQWLAVAVENERDEDSYDGQLPQFPAGHVSIFSMIEGLPICDSQKMVDVTGLAAIGGDDPEPEFVDFNDNNEVIVSLQENNHLVIVDAPTASVVGHFSAGAVDLVNVDVEEERALTFDAEQLQRLREPDAVHWLDTERFVTANEGDYNGGSRGFTIFSRSGDVLFDSALDFEYKAALAGHYPERRSGNKGVEPEGLEVATFGEQQYIFVLAERASLVGVYKDTGGIPEFVQLLPTGMGPEGAVAIESRDLLAVANEVDLIEDGGVRSHVMLYEQRSEVASYPMLESVIDKGRPIGWGALSGLAADDEEPDILYAITDSFYAMAPQLLTINTSEKPAKIVKSSVITRHGAPAQLLDLEGVTSDGDGGFWLASEGRHDRLIAHALYHVNSSGEIQAQVPFPQELLAVQARWGSEGITKIGNTLWIAIQRTWKDDPENTVKLVAYNIEDKSWGAVRYPLEPSDKGWVGLSEITAQGSQVFIIERDNQIANAAVHKKLYKVSADQLKPEPLGEGAELPLVSKELVHDFIEDLTSTNGYVVDKIEGFAIDRAGRAFAVTDNDGVDDSNGETLFFQVELPEDLVMIQ